MSKILILGSDEIPELSGNAVEKVVVTEPLEFLHKLNEGGFTSFYISSGPIGSQTPELELVRNLACTYTILDQSPNGLAILNNSSEFVWTNRRMQEWFKLESVTGVNFYEALGNPDIKGPEVHPIMSAIAKRCLTVTTIAKGDSYYRLQASPIINRENSVEFLIVTLTDTTDTTVQRLKMQALHEAELALSNLTTQEIFEMEVDERVELLKDNILRYTKDLLNFDVVEIRMLDPTTGLLVPLLSEGIDSQESKKPLYALPQGNGVTGFVVATGHSYLCEDTRVDPLYLDGLVGAKSSLTVPLKFNDQVIGSFNVESPEVNAFTDADLEFLESFSRGVASALNTLELLNAQRTGAAHQSVEAIRSAVAIPIDKILSDTTQVMDAYIGHDPEVTNRLREVLRNARDIKASIYRIGESMAPIAELPSTVKTTRNETVRGKRILVIDADEQVCTSAHQLLERQGCYVETAGQGQVALAMVRGASGSAAAYDAIIADIRLPDISGYQLLVSLKEILSNPPLILMTGFGYDPGHSIVKARQEGLRAGAVLYKPFRLDQLLETIENTIRENQSSMTGKS